MMKYLPYFLDVALEPYDEMRIYFREHSTQIIFICVILAIVLLISLIAIIRRIKDNNTFKYPNSTETQNKTDEK